MSITWSQSKELITEIGKENLRGLIEEVSAETLGTILEEIAPSDVSEFVEGHGVEKIKAAIECGVNLSDIDEAYTGQYKSDEDFAQETAEQLGAIDRNASWPNTCIDWEWAAKELMYDYSESDGYYFRNL